MLSALATQGPALSPLLCAIAWSKYFSASAIEPPGRDASKVPIKLVRPPRLKSGSFFHANAARLTAKGKSATLSGSSLDNDIKPPHEAAAQYANPTWSCFNRVNSCGSFRINACLNPGIDFSNAPMACWFALKYKRAARSRMRCAALAS